MKPKGINFIEKFPVFNSVCTLGLCVVFISILEGVTAAGVGEYTCAASHI